MIELITFASVCLICILFLVVKILFRIEDALKGTWRIDINGTPLNKSVIHIK